LTKSISSIDTQVSDLERLVQSNRQALIASFIVMETAQAKLTNNCSFVENGKPSSEAAPSDAT
jgi:hypothetical protein